MVHNSVNLTTGEAVHGIFVRSTYLETMDQEKTEEIPQRVIKIEGEPLAHSEDESVEIQQEIRPSAQVSIIEIEEQHHT